MKTLKQATLFLAIVAFLLSAFAGYSQEYVAFSSVSNSTTPPAGTYTGGTATVTLTGGGGIANPNMRFFSPGPYYTHQNIPATGGAAGSQTLAFVNNSYFNGYKNITFTFSTPVFINDLYIADIDNGNDPASLVSFNDQFHFTDVTFSSVSSNYGGATVGGSGPTPVKAAFSADPVTSGVTDNLGYARWQNSTTPVTSFTITFDPTTPAYVTTQPNEVMNAVGYLQLALKVTPLITISGSVYNDNNGNSDNQITNSPKISTASGQQLYAVAYRISDMTVVKSQAITAGNYSLSVPKIPTGASSGYAVVLTTQNPTEGSTVPITFIDGQLPTGWMYSSGGFGDPVSLVTGDGSFYSTNGFTSSAYSFGIQQVPKLVSVNAIIGQPAGNSIPAGAITTPVNGNDPDGGAGSTNQVLGNGNTYTLYPPTNGILSYSFLINGMTITNVVPAGGLIVPGFNPAKLSFSELSGGSTGTSFNYSYTDAAGATATGVYNVAWPTALPVVFGAIDARIKDGQLLVDFVSEKETSNDHFEIEASTDGETFTKIGTVTSKAENGNSDTAISYDFVTSNTGLMGFTGAAAGLLLIALSMLALNRRNKLNRAFTVAAAVAFIGLSSCAKKDISSVDHNTRLWIRIAQVDKNGKKSYSKVIKVINE